MDKYSNILICSDLDGTLINSNGKLADENKQAIKSFTQGGGKFCLATGRLPEYLLNFFDKSDFSCPVICCNGACIYDFTENKILYECFLGKEIEKVLEYITDNKTNIEQAYFFKELKRCDADIHAIEKNEIINAHKMVLVMNNEVSAINMRDSLNLKFGDKFSFSRSWPVGVEILNINTTKGKTVKRLKGILGDNRISVCVGDYENDVSMIEMADIGCAVDNAVPELKAVDDRIVCSNDDNAIKYIIENILD